MEAKKIEVIYAPKARNCIAYIAASIEEKGYPETAIEFTNKVYTFGNSLAIFPDKYSLCKQPQLTKRKMRCAVFHKNYIFIYKLIKHSLIIFNVIHTKTQPVSFSV